jgi:hypothetical protein
MGQLVIEVPQNVNRSYQVKDADFGKRLLQDLEEMEKKAKPTKIPAIIPPRRNSLKEDLAAVVGIWADREESAEEIARRIRDRNNGKDV